MAENRPKTKYEPWMCDKIVEVAQEGGFVASMCLAIGIKSRDTFYRWLKEYPDFAEAYEETKIVGLERIEQALWGIGLGQVKGNFNAIAMLANNKFKEDYQRTGQGAHTEINIQQLNQVKELTNLSSDALEEKIKMLSASVGSRSQELIEHVEEEEEEHPNTDSPEKESI